MITKTTHLLLLSLFCIGFSISLLGKSQQTKAVLGDTLKPINIIQTLHYTAGQANPKIQLQASRGRKFHWSNGATTSSILVKGGVSGDYSVQIEEENGLLWQLSTSVSSTEKLRVKNPPSNGQQLDQTNSISAVAQAPDCGTVGLGGYYNKICAGTSLTLIASGGDSYLWSTNATTSSITVTPADGQEFSVKISRTSPTTGEVVCETTRTTGPIQVIPKPVAAITVSNNACSVIGTTLTASGGEAYSWSNGATTASIVTQEAVPYSVTVSNGSGLCSDVESVSLTTNFNPQVNGASSICKGAGAQLTASGGGTYQWNNGAIGSRITVLPTSVGTYTYTVTITNGSCSAVKSHTLIVNAAPSAIITGPSAACKNNSFSLSASGGGTYSWSTGQNTASISVTGIQSTQNYSVTVTGSNGCQSTASQQVGVLPAPTLDGPSNVCSGSPANLVVTGGATYSWSTGETTSSVIAFPTGTSQYSVTVTDANNCIYVLNKTLSVENPPSANINGVNTICSGQSTTLSVFGGATYAWSTGASTASITVNPLQNTTYTVTVSSASGCSAIGSKVVTVKPLPNGSISGASSICPGQSTSISASGGGTYAWNTGASTATVVVSPTQNTTYTVSISNAQGCMVVLNHLVSAGLTGTASNDGPLTCTKTSVTLQGNSSATGATYQWKNPSGTTISNTSQASVSTVGIYTLVISAPGGCSYTTTTQVLSDLSTPTAIASNNGPITCALPNVILSASPISVGQTYQWKNSTGTVVGTTASTSVNQAGTYTLVVTGSNGCSSSSSTTLNADLAVPAVSVSNDGPLTCTKTSVALTASSSNPNLQYTWRNSSSAIIASNATVTVTTVGTYTVEARGANGCTTTSSASITQSGSFPNISVNNPGTISCIGSTATISGNSTTPGVSYAWYNPNGRLMSTQKSFIANIAGTYTLKVTSVEGCVSSANTTLGEDVFANQATTLNVGGTYTNSSFAQGELTCTKNSITMSASARFAGYSISVYWTDAAGTILSTRSQLTVSSPGYYYLKQNDCPVKEILIKVNRPTPVVQIGGEQLVCSGKNTTFTASGGSQYSWNTGATTASIVTGNIYSPTTYTVTVSTGAYCSNVASVTVGNHPNPVINITGPTSICLGEPTTLTASGGQSYKWSGSNGTTESIIVYPTVASTYTVTVSSDKGCMASKSHIISTIKSLPVDFTLANVPTTAFCGEALVNLSVLNPNSNYTWKWSTGETTTAIQKTLPSSQTIAITATRGNGCTRSKSASITVIPRPQPQLLGGDINCYGNSTTLTATGGSSFVWSTGETTASIAIYQPTQTNTYTVTVSNAPNCSATAQKTVVVPAALSLTAQIQNDQDCIAGNVQVVANATGGQGALRYQLDNGAFQSLPTFLNVSNGLHTLGVQDVMGCSASANVTIAELSPLQLPNPVVQAVNCFGESNGRISLSPTGGTAPYQYTWSNGSSTAVNQNLRAGTYTVTVTDANGCTVNRSISVSEPTNIGLNLSITASPTCYGGSDGVLQSNVEGGSPAYTYAWSNGGTTAAISNLPANAYALTVTDAHGCLATASITTTQPTPVTVSYTISNDLDCIQNNVIITANASGGRGNYSYRLDGGPLQSSGVFSGKTTGAYTLIAQDGAGCNSLPASININEALPLSLSYSLQNDRDCIAGNVRILPNATGGRGNKTFKIARYAELYFSENLSGLGSGRYTLVVEDSLKCTASQEIEIKETPVGIQALNLQGINDCVAGNTRMEVVTTGNPLVYRLNGQVVNGPVLNISRIAGDYSIEVADASGCSVFQEQYIPAYDSLKIEVTPITDCNNPYGSMQFLVDGWSANQMSSSIDGGQTWVAGNRIDLLTPGVYSTLVRNNQNGCLLAGANFQLDSLDCPSLIGFTKDTIYITKPHSIANLPLAVDYPMWFGQAGEVKIRLQGDGFPHFFDNNSRTNLQLPELRGEVGIDRLLSYPAGYIGADTIAYPLSDSAEYYLFPAVYTFNLIEVSGSLLKIDPDRNTLRVIVRLGPPETVEEQVISICDPSQCPIAIGENFGTGYCYSWEGPLASDQVGKPEISVCPSTETLYTQKILDINTFELVKINTYRIKVGGMKLAIVSNLPGGHELCAGKEATLSAYSLKDGKLITQSKDLKFQWSTGETTNPITVKPAKNKSYKIYVTELKSGCVSQAEDYILVRSNPSVDIAPTSPVICKLGANYLPTELKIANPVTELGYSWSNGASGDKVMVSQPGVYSVTATTNAGCKAEANIQVEENTAVKALSSIDGNFYKLSAKITPVGVNDNPDFEVGTGGMIENHTAFNDFSLEKPSRSSAVSCISVLAGVMSAELFNEVADKKVLILDKSSSCRNPSILAQAKAEILKHAIGFILFMDDAPDGAGTIHILGSNFKDRYTPVSGEHSSFVDTRLTYLNGKNKLPDMGASLHIALNSLVDNFTMTYVDMSAVISGLQPVPGVTRPELRTEIVPDCKYDLTSSTNFLAPSAVVITLNTGATPFFRYKTEVADLAQMGAVTGFTENSLGYYGRYWPPQVKPGIDEYFFIGYDNVTSSPQNTWDLYASPNTFSKDKWIKIWWANIAGGDATKIFELEYFNQKETVQSTGEGDFPVGGDITTIKNGPKPNIVKNPSYIRFQVEKSNPPALTPNQLTLWSIKLGKAYDRTDVLVEQSGEPDLRNGYIVYIPKDPNEIDASYGFYQVYVKFYNDRELPDYYYYDEFLCKWIPYNEITNQEILNAFLRLPALKVLRGIFDFSLTLGAAVYDGGHVYLDLAGLASPYFDVANATWYFAERRNSDGIITLIGAIPVFGDAVVVVKKIKQIGGAVLKFIVKLLLKNGDEILNLIRVIKYVDEAGNVIEAVVDVKKILEGLANSSIAADDLEVILQKMMDPKFDGNEAAKILKAIENDPSIITRNYDLLANSPLLRTNVEVLFKFEELIQGGLSKLKLQEALAGPFGDILNKAAELGADQAKAILDVLGQSHVDDFYISELIRRLNTYPDFAQDLINNPAWMKEYDDLVQDPSKFWELYRQGSFDPKGAFAKWGQGFMFKSLVATAKQFEEVAVKNLLRSEGVQLAEHVTLIITKQGEDPAEIVVDFLVRDPDGSLRIVDAKYTTKDPFNTTTSLTPNQTKAFPWIKDMANNPIQIEVRANSGRLKGIGLTQGDIIPNIKGIDLYVSNPSDPTSVGKKLGF